MKASILAVGTEITTGQILNKNASALSAKLKIFGIDVTFHLTVPDNRQLIMDALNFAENQSELLFVTGGLGPTSDDFTRDLISEWSGLKMKFDEKSWAHVQDRLSSRGFSVREMQRQQCYFPETAEILTNSSGTANAFCFTVNRPSGRKIVFVLPGPPREIESVWKDYIQNKLEKLTVDIKKNKTKSWDTLGLGESDVAALVEKALTEFQNKNFVEIGYRVHLPYVEVKVTFAEDNQASVLSFLESLDSSLKHITITKDFIDLAEVTSTALKDLDFTFYDYVSSGYLHLRLQPFLKNHPNWSWKQSTEIMTADLFENEENFLALLPVEDGEKLLLLLDIGGVKKRTVIDSPYKSSLMLERKNQYFAEMALVFLAKTREE